MKIVKNVYDYVYTLAGQQKLWSIFGNEEQVWICFVECSNCFMAL